jgi:hypothetical protein
MKVTFYRQGHSNNSSSSHSLIFTSKEPPRDTSNVGDFGWDHFVCSNRESKLSYIVHCLMSSWESVSFNTYFSLPWFEKSLYGEDCGDFRTEFAAMKSRLFRSYLRNMIGLTESVNLDGYGVDHQSQITFPVDRRKEYIHTDFAKKFIAEFVNNSWYVFGGNDNEEVCYDPPVSHEHTPQTEDYATVWNFLRDREQKSVICVYDDMTDEYVLSRSGGLIKIKF